MLDQIETLNRAAFLWLNAPAAASQATLLFAKFWAEWAILLAPLGMVLAWLRVPPLRPYLLQAAMACLLGLTFNLLIGHFWYHPRPFEIGLGHTYVLHQVDSSFPSDHATLVWAVACSLLWQAKTCKVGAVLIAWGLPIAWARIYLGVHYPADMVGALLVSLSCAWLLAQAWGVLEPLFFAVQGIYRWLCAPLIRRGWFVE